MGRGHFKYAGTRVVAICDVDKGHIKQALGMLDKGVKTFADYRELITLPEVDIVHIATPPRSEEHTSELKSLMRTSYAVFCLKKKHINRKIKRVHPTHSFSSIINTF